MHLIPQPIYTDCRNCGSCEHSDYECPCGCHPATSTPPTYDADCPACLRDLHHSIQEHNAALIRARRA